MTMRLAMLHELIRIVILNFSFINHLKLLMLISRSNGFFLNRQLPVYCVFWAMGVLAIL
jgi:hypothetical protein